MFYSFIYLFSSLPSFNSPFFYLSSKLVQTPNNRLVSYTVSVNHFLEALLIDLVKCLLKNIYIPLYTHVTYVRCVIITLCCRGNNSASYRYLGRACISTRPNPGRIRCGGHGHSGSQPPLREVWDLARTHPLTTNPQALAVACCLPVGHGRVTLRPTRLGDCLVVE